MIESDMLIFCFINMLDDSFDFKSFIIDVILNSLEKIFWFLALINIEVTDMTFINDSLILELCEHFDIQSISLFKSKSICSYDEILDRRFITHALYISVIIQEHKNKMMSLLIIRLDQHKIIIDNFWLKRNQILINSANNWLISSSNIQILKLIISKTSSQSAFHQLELSEICKIKRKNLKFMSIIILKRTTNSKSVNWFIESALIRKQSTQIDLNQHELIQSSKKKEFVNIIMIKVVAYQTLVKKKNIKIFTLIISEINKMLSSIKDSAKLNEMISVMSLKKLKKKLSIVYHDFLNVFDREKTIQLLSHQSYDHKIELEDEN